jgi:hypothetical protein
MPVGVGCESTVLRGAGTSTVLHIGATDIRAASANEGRYVRVRVSAPVYEGMHSWAR